MGKARTAAVIGVVGGAIILGAWLIPKAIAKPPEPTENMASIIGQVRDQQLNYPIPYATLTIDDITLTADEGGYFGIDRIPLAKYAVKVTAPGYRSKIYTWTLGEEKEYWIEIELTPVETLW
ncbi:hypothetical protein ES703_85660 [subsurface metagenome]